MAAAGAPAIVERSRALLAEPGGWGRFGFYTTGQLFPEEYYTLAVIGKAGIGKAGIGTLIVAR